MNKKGFTLVELLAVIAILAILVLIALPNVMSLFNEAKANSFTTELKNIYKSAQQQWMRDSMFETNQKVYARCKSNTCPNELKLSGRNNIEYFIKINKGGKVIEFYATDGTYQYSYKGNELKIENIEKPTQIANITNGKYVTITCNGGGASSPAPSNTDDYLMGGTSGGAYANNYLRTTIVKSEIEKITFTDSIAGHTANGTDCWDVSKGQTGSVLAWATDINNNGKYELTIGANGDVYAYTGEDLFNSLVNLISIEGIQYLNTSKVTSMYGMFEYCTKLTSLDLSHFDTSNVTNMYSMFLNCSNLNSIDLSHFDTSKVTNMGFMFSEMGNITSINFGNFNTSKVTNMEFMFYADDKLVTIDLKSFDTSLVTNMSLMFNACGELTTIYASNNFVTSAVTNSQNMFGSSKLVGGSGTTYDSNHVDATYAHIDGGPSNPGYFTRK